MQEFSRIQEKRMHLCSANVCETVHGKRKEKKRIEKRGLMGRLIPDTWIGRGSPVFQGYEKEVMST